MAGGLWRRGQWEGVGGKLGKLKTGKRHSVRSGMAGVPYLYISGRLEKKKQQLKVSSGTRHCGSALRACHAAWAVGDKWRSLKRDDDDRVISVGRHGIGCVPCYACLLSRAL